MDTDRKYRADLLAMVNKQRSLVCPACGEILEWTRMFSHFQEVSDDAHIELESKMESYCDDAYFDAEVEMLSKLCEEA